MNTSEKLPDYSTSLRAFHKAFGRELKKIIKTLPLPPASTILDVPCGEGFYTAALARRLNHRGKLIAVDQSAAYLERAKRRLNKKLQMASIELIEADVYGLSFPDNTFDLVWCARSLISLSEPVAALREMKRVLKPNGIVAVLEDDEFHRIMFNGPVKLEIDLHRASAEVSKEKYGSRAGLSPARRVHRFLNDAGLRLQRRKTFTADRQAPFDFAVKDYLKIYFAELREYVAKHLSAENLAILDELRDPESEASFIRRADAEATCLTTLFVARK